MRKTITRGLIAVLLAVLLAAGSDLSAQEKEKEPAVSIVLGPRQAAAAPYRQCVTHTGGGNIIVAQPAADTVVVTMTGAAAAGSHPCKDSAANFTFELEQCFEVVFHDPKVKKALLILEGQTVGLLRSRCLCCTKKVKEAGIATPGHASVSDDLAEVLSLSLPPRSVCCGENLSINDREGPLSVQIMPGKYTLRQMFGISVAHNKSFLCGKYSSADFAPGEVLKEEWIGDKDPFRGASKKEFGFQVTLKVIPE